MKNSSILCSIISTKSLLKCLLLFAVIGVSHASDVDYSSLKPKYFATVKNGYKFSDTVQNQQRNFRVVNTKSTKGVEIKIKKSWKRHGIFYLYSSRKLKKQAIYDNGKKNGVETKYRSSTGAVFSHTDWMNGLQHGDETKYNKNGGKSQQCNWVDGKRHGQCSWFHPNGNVSTERTYVKGKKHGILKSYNKNGKLSYTEMFENDKQVGKTNWAH